MQISAEVRWFWQAEPPAGLADWFLRASAAAPAAGGGRTRVDVYLFEPGLREVGVKRRGPSPGLEIKGLIETARETIGLGGLAAAPELWCKWTVAALSLPPSSRLGIEKRRWLRKLAVDAATGGTPAVREVALDEDESPMAGERRPELGCNVELTRLQVDGGDVWWTLGFEAFGGLSAVRDALAAAVETMAGRRPPPLGPARCASYPAWIADLPGGGPAP